MRSPTLTVLISRIGETQPNLSATNAVLIGLIVFVVVIPPWYTIVEVFSVMAHEGAHALTSWGLGGSVNWIQLNSDGTGVTSSFEPGSLSYGLAVLAGYAGPSAGGLLAAKLISKGHSVAVLWLTLVLLGFLLLQVSSFFSVCTVVMAGAVIYLSVRYMAVLRETIMAYVIAWFMLLSGLRTVLVHGIGASDGYLMRNLTSLPRLVWFLVWLAAAGWALITGAKMLV